VPPRARRRRRGGGGGVGAADVVFVDIGLPGIDGFEVARRLRAKPDLAGCLLVAMSGYGRDTDKQHARHAGFHHHLTKPVDLDAIDLLLSRIRPAAAEAGDVLQ
jgi:CheY-like chemotaxis protein